MAMLLDSALPGVRARYAYIAVDPFRVICSTAFPWRVTVDGTAHPSDPFSVLAGELARFASPERAGPVPFMGGAVGFFAYELGGVLEATPAPKISRDPPYCPEDMVMGLYDTIAAFDLERRQAWVIAHDIPESDPSGGRAGAQVRAQRLAEILGTGTVHGTTHFIDGLWRAETTRRAHEARVAAAIEAIGAGDIYQANITQRFVAEIADDVPSFDLYLRLRAASPAPFAAFINAGEGCHIISASPERFLKVSPGGAVETRPVKGTRPRGATAPEDQRLAAELLASAKDRAENLMIVDLLRNDLARVCRAGSVTVPALCNLESFASVHHLVSVVTGQLRAGATALDLLRAAFPGGSITGAPKIKAMEIIHALEPSPRGPYCGTIAWFGFDGAMDSSIVIRTLVRNGIFLSAQAGGGIVAESDPAGEYDESLTKLGALLSIVGGGKVAGG